LYLSAHGQAIPSKYLVSHLLPATPRVLGTFLLWFYSAFYPQIGLIRFSAEWQIEFSGWVSLKNRSGNYWYSESTRCQSQGSMPQNGAALWICVEKQTFGNLDGSEGPK
jgi:hypothetical protein